MTHRAAAGFATAGALFVLAACGGAHAPSSQAVAERQWIANAAELIDQLRGDVQLSANGGDSVAAARAALRNESDLYALLIAYSDFGGCHKMLANVGMVTGGLGRADSLVSGACNYLEQAAKLFVRAATNSDPHALLGASRAALKASPLLIRAKFELDRLAR